MQQLAKYKPLIMVFFKDIDGTINNLSLDATKKTIFEKALKQDQFIEIEGVGINKFLIQKYEVISDPVESLYYSQKKDFRIQMDKKYSKDNDGRTLLKDLDFKFGKDVDRKIQKLQEIINDYQKPVKKLLSDLL